MTAEMKGLLSEAFASNKIRGVVITGVENAQLEEAAQKYGIDAQKYALILSYLALGGSGRSGIFFRQRAGVVSGNL